MKLSFAMHQAQEAVAGGMSVGSAATLFGVSQQGLYKALRRSGQGTRCPTCGHLDRAARKPLQEASEPATSSDQPATV